MFEPSMSAARCASSAVVRGPAYAACDAAGEMASSVRRGILRRRSINARAVLLRSRAATSAFAARLRQVELWRAERCEPGQVRLCATSMQEEQVADDTANA